MLRCRQRKGNQRAGSILGLAMVGSQSLPLSLKGQMEGAVLGEPKEKENIGEG